MNEQTTKLYDEGYCLFRDVFDTGLIERLRSVTDRLLRPAETAELLDISTHTLKAWRHRGFGPRYKRFPGARGEIRYVHSEVLEWMHSDLHESYAEEVSRRAPDEVEVEPQTPAVKERGYDTRTGRYIVRDGGA